MPIISLDVGSVNLARSSARVLVFHAPTDPSMKEVNIYTASGETARHIQRRGYQAKRPSVAKRMHAGEQRVPQDMTVYGYMQASSYTVPNGTIIKVMGQTTSNWSPNGSSAGISKITANRYYLVRDGAALLDVKVRMLRSVDCVTDHASISGPLERLTVEQAEALGVTPQREEYRKLYRDDVCDYVFSETVLAPASTEVTIAPTAQPAAQPGVPTVAGPAAVLVALPTKRRRQIGVN
jgi:hypothetical protein